MCIKGFREGLYKRKLLVQQSQYTIANHTPSSSLLHPIQSPTPPRSALLTFLSSKNSLAGSQSSSVRSRFARVDARKYILSITLLSALTCLHGRGRRDLARMIPREERRKPR